MKKLLFLVPLIALTINSCGIINPPEQTVIKGTETLNEGLRKIDNHSNSWRKVLEETRDKLIQEGQSTLANEVSNVLSRAESDLGIEGRCYTDYFRDRTKEDLIKIRAKVTKEKLQLQPVFCNVTPESINLNEIPEKLKIIEIPGYNLTKEGIQVLLVDDLNQSIDVSNSLENPTSYKLTVMLDRVPLNNNSEKLIFKLPKGEVRSIGIIKAYKPPKVEFRSSRVHITGTINMNDDEWTKDENKTIAIDHYVVVTSDTNQRYHWEDCVGGEVQGYLDAQLQLNKETGEVLVQVLGRYYEGTSCGETDLQGSGHKDMGLDPGESDVYDNQLKDNDGEVDYNLNFKNESVDKVMIPQTQHNVQENVQQAANLYRTILGREPEAGAAEGLATRLANGSSLAREREIMAGSQESRNNLVNLYRTILGREPEGGAVDGLVTRLANGSSLAQEREIMSNSQEARERGREQ